MAPIPSRLQIDLSKYEKLDRLQAGHLRHIHNLASLPDGEWHHMGSQEPQQEFLDAFRYQLAQMSYAASVAHYHRLPAARSLFKPLIRQLIQKMLHPTVWGYWYLTSQSGSFVDPGRTELRKPWADPVIEENIMYSGHLLLMTSLYAMLFDDDEFEKPGSLTFRWAPLFWGFGPQEFHYDNRSLQKGIVDQMERNNWVGVCCEPNSVFVVCNQFPIIAMRYNDVRDNTSVVKEVLAKYEPAVKKHGLIRSDGTYAEWLYLKQGQIEQPKGVQTVAWANAFMNAWNSEIIYGLYEKQVKGFVTNIDGKVELQLPEIGWAYRRIAEERDVGNNDSFVLELAREEASKEKPAPFPYTSPVLGYVVQWLSELGKTAELQGLLDTADANLQPTWENGGLFYPRNDRRFNDEGNWTHMDPFTGNAGIAYARLNVQDGQKIMWDNPRSQEYFQSQPWIDGVELGDGIDCLRSVWDADAGALVLTMQTWDGRPRTVQPSAMNVPLGQWAVYVGEELVLCEGLEEGGKLTLEVLVNGAALDVVFVKVD
ncbi:hypothetical protein CkaCkLH20_09527 [Colletotrichum karsti]|uniref:Linalool dehydratase/isomerase domain-containing protein n=1 Tax=Colletotrichum karsti TaxID=1095194 RepID=A0A9P6LHX4_9PEZI|nr:uncharacterized protein CkaCkLH20_09527 [Colletotrichum karsti]KAF9873017.1 hypothetical protein CkaCkLH20_09527 [Colletotrichum karsti]